jgi:DNA-binding CsgD family transcriptional regulator
MISLLLDTCLVIARLPIQPRHSFILLSTNAAQKPRKSYLAGGTNHSLDCDVRGKVVSILPAETQESRKAIWMSNQRCLQNLGARGIGQSDAVAVLVDSRGILLSPTVEALRVLLYPREIPPNGESRQLGVQRLRALFPAGPLSEATAPEGEFISGRRRYLYRIYRFGDPSPNRGTPVAVIVLERNHPPLVPPPVWLAAYRFSLREEQVLRLVLMGLSNKQIAERIGISPNTVKVFLRLIMTKMEVTSRFGILGKLLGRAGVRGQAVMRPAQTPAGVSHRARKY